MRRGRHPRRDHHLGRLPRDRPRGRGARGADPRRGAALRRDAHPRPQLPRRHRARPRASTPASPAACPRPGNVAFISQSGALCTSVLDWALEEDIGFSYFVSVGNMLDVDFGDLIDYFGEDEQTDSIILYIESISRRAPVHDRGARLRAHQADRRLQGRALPRVGAGRRLAHRRAGLARTRSTTRPSSAPASRGSSRSATSSTAPSWWAATSGPPGRGWPSSPTPAGPGVMATDALIARARRAGRALAGDARRARRGPAAVLVARQPGGRARRRHARSASPRPSRSCSPTPAWTRCWPSSRRRR